MTATDMHELITLLKDTAHHVHSIEKEAEIALHTHGDESAYRQQMRQKAELLASLHTTSLPALALLPDSPAKAAISDRLMRFSQSASTALNLKSVFYMSALLYPEDHVPGTPNDLEIFIDSLSNTPS